MKICVLGGGGYLGSFLCKQLSPTYDVVSVSRSNNTDIKYPFGFHKISDYSLNSLDKMLQIELPDVVVNTVAYTDVDGCEKNKVLAVDLNCCLPRSLAQLSNNEKFRLIHISTDQLWSDEAAVHSVSESVFPINNYADTKARGEQEIIGNDCYGTIIRVNFFHNSIEAKHQKNFWPWIVNSYLSSTRIVGFTDIYYTPISTYILTEFLQFIIANKKYGIFQVASNKPLNKYQFIKKTWDLMDDMLGLSKSKILEEGTSDSYQFNAVRPKYMSMIENISKLGFEGNLSVDNSIKRALVDI